MDREFPEDAQVAGSRRGTYHHGELRAALIDATDAIIRENGIEGFSLREAARRAGVSPSAPAHHFGSATGLLTAVATLGYHELGREMSLVVSSGNAAANVRAYAATYVLYALTHPGRFRLMCRKDLVDRDASLFIEASEIAMMGFAAAAASYHGGTLTDGPKVLAGVLASIAAAHGIAYMTIEEKWTFALDPHDREKDFRDRLLPEILKAQWGDRP